MKPVSMRERTEAGFRLEGFSCSNASWSHFPGASDPLICCSTCCREPRWRRGLLASSLDCNPTASPHDHCTPRPHQPMSVCEVGGGRGTVCPDRTPPGLTLTPATSTAPCAAVIVTPQRPSHTVSHVNSPMCSCAFGWYPIHMRIISRH